MIITKVATLSNTFQDIFSINELDLIKNELLAAEKVPAICPRCKTSDFIVSNGYYDRHYVTYTNQTVADNHISIHCVHCTSCNHSHAILPADLIPYASYSPVFLFSVILDFCTKTFSNYDALAAHYDISVKTLIKIIKTYWRDYLFIQAIIKELAYLKICDLIIVLIKLSASQIYSAFYLFRTSYSYSFLQGNVKLLLKNRKLRPISKVLQ